MIMKRTFEMNGKQYTSMMEIARELGVNRIYPRDFGKYNIIETTGQAAVEATQDVEEKPQETKATEEVKAEEKVEEKKTTVEKSEKKQEKNQKESKVEKKTVKTDKVEKDQPKVDRRFTRKVGTPEEIQEVQDKVGQMTIVEFNNFIKHFSVEALVQMAETSGVNTWESIDNEPIRRMRLLMELKGHYFPNEKTPVKPNSGWRKIELAELIKLAKSKKVEYKTSDDEKIQRMHVVIALNKAGLTPDDIVTKEDKSKKNA